MSTENPSSPKELLPFAILSLSVILLLVWASMVILTWKPAAAAATPQTGDSALDDYFAWQSTVIEDQRITAKAAKDKLEKYYVESIPQWDQATAKSKQTEESLQKLCYDLLDLAKTDPDAAAIVKRYDIKAPPPGASPSPAPGD